MAKVPSVVVCEIVYESMLTTQPAAKTRPTNGEVSPSRASSVTVVMLRTPSQLTLSTATTDVPPAGALTKYSAWSYVPTLPPASSSVATASIPSHASERS